MDPYVAVMFVGLGLGVLVAMGKCGDLPGQQPPPPTYYYRKRRRHYEDEDD